MNPKFTDHIMPHRCLRHLLWVIVESATLLVIFKISAVVWRTVYYAVPILYIPVILLLAFGMTAFLAKWEALRLERDATLHGDFMASTADGSYDGNADAKLLLHCDEYKNDVAVVAVFYVVVLVFMLVCTFFSAMMNVDWTYDESLAYFINALFVNIPVYVVYVIFYAFWHHRLTLSVHKNWNGDRIRKAEKATAEKLPYM